MHLLKAPMKFRFGVQDIQLSMPEVDVAGKLVLVWKRGPRRTQTEPFEVKEKLSSIDGSLSRTASTPQDLALICTMYRNKGTGSFESKDAKFQLKEESETGEESKLGTATIDLSSYATPEPSSDRVELSFMDGKIRLQLTITSYWLKASAGVVDDDDDASSAGSVSSRGAGGSEDDQDLSSWSRPGGGGSSVPEPSALPSGGQATTPPVGMTERERDEAARTAAVERQWEQQADRAKGMEEAEALRVELAEAREMLADARKEAKALRARVDRLTSENRVLRREQRGGSRDEVILQLEAEVVSKDEERAEMEEQLAKAFSGALADASSQISALKTERDRLMVGLEEAASKRGGFMRK